MSGIYHVVASTPASKYALGLWFTRQLRLDFSRVRRGRLADLRLVPPRPARLVLDTSKARKALKARLPTSRDTARQLALDYRHEFP